MLYSRIFLPGHYSLFLQYTSLLTNCLCVGAVHSLCDISYALCLPIFLQAQVVAIRCTTTASDRNKAKAWKQEKGKHPESSTVFTVPCFLPVLQAAAHGDRGSAKVLQLLIYIQKQENLLKSKWAEILRAFYKETTLRRVLGECYCALHDLNRENNLAGGLQLSAQWIGSRMDREVCQSVHSEKRYALLKRTESNRRLRADVQCLIAMP